MFYNQWQKKFSFFSIFSNDFNNEICFVDWLIDLMRSLDHYVAYSLYKAVQSLVTPI